MIVLLVMTDGRKDYLVQTIASVFEHLDGPITRMVIFDDSADDAYHVWLQDRFGPDGFEVVRQPGERLGFGGAIRTAWAWLRENTNEPFVWHQEDDFTFNRHVYTSDMIAVMLERPHLAQMALVRQPWSETECNAGGLIAVNPSAYSQHTDGRHWWLQHRLFYTTNPSLFSRSLLDIGWPEGDHSEGIFHHELMARGLLGTPAEFVWYGYWGRKDDGPWVHHIGYERTGTGY